MGGASLALKDISSFEWVLKYKKDHRHLLLCLGNKIGTSVILGGHVFSYGKVLLADYQDEDSNVYKVCVWTSEGECELLLSKGRLVVEGFHPLEVHHVLREQDNIIITLQPFISGHISFAETEEDSLDDDTEGVKQK